MTKYLTAIITFTLQTFYYLDNFLYYVQSIKKVPFSRANDKVYLEISLDKMLKNQVSKCKAHRLERFK